MLVFDLTSLHRHDVSERVAKSLVSIKLGFFFCFFLIDIFDLRIGNVQGKTTNQKKVEKVFSLEGGQKVAVSLNGNCK